MLTHMVHMIKSKDNNNKKAKNFGHRVKKKVIFSPQNVTHNLQRFCFKGSVFLSHYKIIRFLLHKIMAAYFFVHHLSDSNSI